MKGVIKPEYYAEDVMESSNASGFFCTKLELTIPPDPVHWIVRLVRLFWPPKPKQATYDVYWHCELKCNCPPAVRVMVNDKIKASWQPKLFTTGKWFSLSSASDVPSEFSFNKETSRSATIRLQWVSSHTPSAASIRQAKLMAVRRAGD